MMFLFYLYSMFFVVENFNSVEKGKYSIFLVCIYIAE